MTLLDLISEPFGPYPDASILSEDFPKMIRAPKKFELKNVYMKSKGQPTGLDETEYVGTPARKIPSVQFYGLLKIEDLHWLSPQGHAWLQNALRERDEVQNPEITKSGLTLKTVYGSLPGTGSKISVWIYYRKVHQASFLTKGGHYKGDLVFETSFGAPKPKPVFWTILSLDIKTASLSRNYLEHWRFFDFIKQLHLSNPAFPLQQRTPKWIMLALKQRFQVDAVHHRHDFDPDLDSDVDGEGKTTLPRRPRHLSSAEVYGVMASHAEWFLAQQLVTWRTSHTYVNLKSWYKFCLKVQQAKAEKRRLQREVQPWRKWMWGDPYMPPSKKRQIRSQRPSQTGVVDLSQFGTVPGGWEARIERRCINYEFPKVQDHEGYPSGEQEIEDNDVHGRPMYDSDMLSDDGAAPPDSDSDSDSDVDVQWVRTLPQWLMYMPVMYPGQLRWCCPDRGCGYFLDLLDMKRSSRFSGPMYDFLWSDSLVIGDVKVQEFLLSLIEEHYNEHLLRLGYAVLQPSEKKVRIERWQPDGESNDTRHKELNIKEEAMNLDQATT